MMGPGGTALAYSVPAVETAIKLLDHLRSHGGDKSLADLCDTLGIPRSTGFNVMKTLEKHGFVTSDTTSKRYRLGWALIALGAQASEQTSFAEVVRPYLEELGGDTGLTCVLAQRLGDHLMIVDKVETSNDIRVTATVGRHYPLGAGAIGKALLAFESDEEVMAYIERRGLPAFTPYSITSADEFLRDLAETRSRGYARSREEYVGGVNVVGSPIFSSNGRADLTIAALGLTSSLPPERFEEFGLRVVGAARRISAALDPDSAYRSLPSQPTQASPRESQATMVGP